jgi:hypothetical protein
LQTADFNIFIGKGEKIEEKLTSEKVKSESGKLVSRIPNFKRLSLSNPLTHQSHPFTAPPLKISFAFFSTSGDSYALTKFLTF